MTLTPGLVRAFRDHAAEFRFSGSPWVFHHTTTRARYAKGSRLVSLRRSFATAAARATLPSGLRMHDLRHRCTDLLARDADVVQVQATMGHSDVRTTMRYLHLSREYHARATRHDGAAGGRGADS